MEWEELDAVWGLGKGRELVGSRPNRIREYIDGEGPTSTREKPESASRASSMDSMDSMDSVVKSREKKREKKVKKG